MMASNAPRKFGENASRTQVTVVDAVTLPNHILFKNQGLLVFSVLLFAGSVFKLRCAFSSLLQLLTIVPKAR